MRIEQMLRRLDGVADVTAEVRTGTVAVTWRPAARLDLARLKAQFFAWRGAVRYGATAAVVTGSLHHDDQGWRLEASVTHQPFRLLPAPRKDRAATTAFDSLPAAAAAAARLRVTGALQEGRGEALALVVTSVEPAPP